MEAPVNPRDGEEGERDRRWRGRYESWPPEPEREAIGWVMRARARVIWVEKGGGGKGKGGRREGEEGGGRRKGVEEGRRQGRKEGGKGGWEEGGMGGWEDGKELRLTTLTG